MIALGVLVFAVVAMIGLLTVGLDAGQSSHVDTLDAMMAESVAAGLRTNDLASWDSLAFPTRYFDHGGRPLPGAAGAYFACTVTPLANDAAVSSWATNGLRRFRLTLVSPVSSPSPLTNVFHSAIARPLD